MCQLSQKKDTSKKKFLIASIPSSLYLVERVTGDMWVQVPPRGLSYICIMRVKKRDYKKEYAKYGKGGKAKRYRAALNRINRRKGTYGNGDGLDEAHMGISDATKQQPQSINRANNRPRRRRSR